MNLYIEPHTHRLTVMVSKAPGGCFVPENGMAKDFAEYRERNVLTRRDIEYIEDRFGMKVQIVAPANGRGIIREVNRMEVV